MLFINGHYQEVLTFPAGEQQVNLKEEFLNLNGQNVVTWAYRGDQSILELFQIMSVFAHYPHSLDIEYEILYMPYARMDRIKSKNQCFSLDMITKMIRNLTSKTIKVLEPHSDVTLQKLQAGYMGLNGAYSYYYWTMDKLRGIGFDPELDALVFPDKGAMNRYANRYPEAKNLIVGSKNRDFATGEIISITAELVKGTATVRKAFVIDDICSYGGTFKRLKTDALVHFC